VEATKKGTEEEIKGKKGKKGGMGKEGEGGIRKRRWGMGGRVSLGFRGKKDEGVLRLRLIRGVK